MATVYGVNKTKLRDGSASNILDSGLNRAQVNSIFDYYEAAALAANTMIEVGGKIPYGAKILDIQVSADALVGTSCTLAVGDASDPDRYITAYSAISATAKSLIINGVVDSIGYSVGTATADDQIFVTTAGSSITGTIAVVITYAI